MGKALIYRGGSSSYTQNLTMCCFCIVLCWQFVRICSCNQEVVSLSYGRIMIGSLPFFPLMGKGIFFKLVYIHHVWKKIHVTWEAYRKFGG
jgi:hypothetical protein